MVTFGLSSIEGSADESPNYLNAMRFQNTAGTGNLVKLEILIDDISPTGNVRMGIYADNNGSPGSRLLDAGEVNVSNGWVGSSGLNLPVTQGTYYWLVFVLQSTNRVSGRTGQPANSHHWYYYAYNALPSPYNVNGTDHGSSDAQWAMRATVSVGP
ncbi:MAG: hypothetical protein A2Z29_02395 [Chloroflexi bacterium RBG_16_56_11]|nr:MAG: hypothetical protein A2Z29_02395 [Chloroflexi bacterium RBG_16_56_11]